MPLTFAADRSAPADADITAVLLAVGASVPPGVDGEVASRLGFEGKAGSCVIVNGTGGDLVALVGLGDAGDGETIELEALRKAGATLARAVRRHRSLAVTLPAGPGPGVRDACQALGEGLALASYSYDRFKSDPDTNDLSHVVVVVDAPEVDAAAAGLARADRVTAAVCWARDLVNAPGGTLTPEALADAAVEMAQREGLTITVLDHDAIIEQRLGGLLGVNRGSTLPPRFIEVRHVPAGESRGCVALVGKGITFDSGGLSIKPADSMVGMQGDMGGAAAVLGAISVAGTFAPDLEVRAYVPATDNMLGGDATRPGDVLTIRNGTTVEVLNTDAEGRLVLADALCVAAEAEPDAIVDLATLTGACMVGLGNRIAGLMANDDGWSDQVRAAGDRTGERLWPLPLPDDYRSFLDSPVADLKNVGPRWGGALTAGLFLQAFVPEGVAWAHLDIAGPAWTDEQVDLSGKGGTGFGVRTLVALMEDFTPPH